MARAGPGPGRSTGTSTELTAVAEAIGRQDYEVALGQAVLAWRASRHPVLADVIDAVAARCKPLALAGRDKQAFQTAWLALAERAAAGDDPTAVGALAGGLAARIPVREVSYLVPRRDVKRYRAFLDRVEALAECGDDPRTATAIADVIERAPFPIEDVLGVIGPAIDLLIRIGDERSIAKLRGLVARPVAKTATVRDAFADALPKAADQIERGSRKRRALTDGERAIAEQVIAALGAKRAAAAPIRDIAELVAECLAHPDDDGPREVLADALLERDDPRGEHIQLQLRDARAGLAEVDVKRMTSIQRKHEKDWLGDICRCTKLRGFRRGFLDEAELLQGAAADPATWERVAADPRMATVRVLHKGNASEELYRTFAFSPALQSLRDIVVPTTKMLRDLPGIPRELDEITLGAGLTDDALALLDHIAATTGVKKLAFATRRGRESVLAQLAAWPARTRFEQLCAIPHHSVAGEYTSLEWLCAFERLAPVKRLGAGDARDRIVFERTPRGFAIDVVAKQESSAVWLASQQLPAAITRVVIRGRRDGWCNVTDAFARAVAKLGADRVELRESWAHVPVKTGRGRAPRARRP